MCTTKNAPKLPALRSNPTAALTIDTEVHPPKIPLIRGRAALDVVDSIPDEYLQASGTYEMTPEQRVAWEAEAPSLYDGMVRIVVTPTWAKLIDFETVLLVVGYDFDLTTNALTPHYAANPAAGTAHAFVVYRAAGEVGPAVSLASIPERSLNDEVQD